MAGEKIGGGKSNEEGGVTLRPTKIYYQKQSKNCLNV